ncbi:MULTISPECIES: hypothetical protein [Methylobacterium]|uniref:Uncharacterized protein n=1 Tax=Methylobacterium hispanicum TaxID=270350 RepID=A0AAV4ZQ88_9HYPH|nr:MULTISPECIES: hypothetical protein [Methylobacterium]GJD90347.1 hypothetical protein BHAOGJBA_3885 [Methylobacterium hispanicum]
MTKTRRSVQRGPVVLNDNTILSKARRPHAEHAASSLMETLDGPLPGTLLVQLSRLHRSEQARLSATEAGPAEIADGPRRG